jgi:hypothetical protein
VGSSVLLPTPGQPKTGPDAGFVSGSRPAITTFGFEGITPPSPLYIQRDDVLFVQAATSQTNEVVTFSGRLLQSPFPFGGQPDQPGRVLTEELLRSSNNIIPFTVVLQPSNTRAVVSAALPLSEGYLLSLACVSTVAITRGQTFARASIINGGATVQFARQALFADYVTTQIAGGYPVGRILSPLEGPGFIRSVTNASPGAGADWNFPVPTNARWRVISGDAQLVTGAAVANRQVELQVLAVAQIVYTGPSIVNQVATTTVLYSWTGLGPYTPINAQRAILPIPPGLYLSANAGGAQSLASNTVNIQGADLWGAQALGVEEWLENV